MAWPVAQVPPPKICDSALPSILIGRPSRCFTSKLHEEAQPRHVVAYQLETPGTIWSDPTKQRNGILHWSAASRESCRSKRETHKRKEITPRSSQRLARGGRQSAGKLAAEARTMVKLFHALPVIGEPAARRSAQVRLSGPCRGSVSVRLFLSDSLNSPSFLASSSDSLRSPTLPPASAFL